VRRAIEHLQSVESMLSGMMHPGADASVPAALENLASPASVTPDLGQNDIDDCSTDCAHACGGRLSRRLSDRDILPRRRFDGVLFDC